MDDILADLIRTAGRTEQKIDNLIDRFDERHANHERRLRRLEKLASKVMGVVTLISLPLTFLYNRYIKRDA